MEPERGALSVSAYGQGLNWRGDYRSDMSLLVQGAPGFAREPLALALIRGKAPDTSDSGN